MAERDLWDKSEIVAKIVGAVALPLIILLIGRHYNRAQEEASRRDLALRDSIAAEERRADRLAGLITHLSSERSRERLIAIRVADELSIHNQLPPEIVPVLAELARAGTDSVEKAAAQSAVAVAEGGDVRRSELIQRLFDVDSRSRISASESLVQSAAGDPEMVGELLRYAGQHLDNGNGVFNTLGVLTQICPGATRRYQPQIGEFIAQVSSSRVTGPRIQQLIRKLQACK